MDTAKVHLRKSPTDNEFADWDASLDEPVEVLAEALRTQFQLPDQQASNPLVYFFMHKEGPKGNVALKGQETFRNAGVQEGHHLTLVSEQIAGGSNVSRG
jgi:hypothetical protein